MTMIAINVHYKSADCYIAIRNKAKDKRASLFLKCTFQKKFEQTSKIPYIFFLFENEKLLFSFLSFETATNTFRFKTVYLK